MCQRAAAFFLLTLLPALTACSRSAGVFSEQNARAHVSMLAETIGSRPIGSEANARARAYVIEQLRLYGYEVRVQETDAQRPDLGRTARVSNVIASLRGQRSEAIGLVAHYDSAPESPGAGDDGLGVAVVLETARVVAARSDRRWTTFVLLTDGEEAGLMGAAALVKDRVIATNLKAYINVEGAGSDGAAVLFQTGPGNGWLTGAWARRAPHPRGGSFGIEVYRRLPNDTDFTIFARESIPGLNFAVVDDGYSYHTARDEADRLTSRSLRMTGENVAAVAEALERVDISTRERWEATYFDIGRMTALSYGMVASWIIDAAALLLGVVATVRATRTTIRRTGGLGFAAMALWSVLGSAAVVAAMVVTTEAVRAGRAVYHPWYAYPDRLFGLLLAVGLATGWAMARTGAFLPPRVRGFREPLITWALALPLWILLASAATWFAPSAAYLWTVPLFVASVCLIVTSHRSAEAVRIASVVVLGVSGTLWLRNTVELLRFAAALFGRLPVIMPVYVFAALITAAGVMVVPPMLAIVSRPAPLRRPVLVTALCLIAVAVSAAAAELAPAYTYDRPLRRYARALQEPDAPTALWEVASIEPGLDLAPGAPPGWTLQRDTAPVSVPWGRYNHPFVFRTRGESLGPAPAEVTGFSLTPRQDLVDLSVSLVPHRGSLTASFVLPAGVVPSQTSLPGALRIGRWVATFVAPPSEGIAWRATFRAADAGRLRDLRVAVTDAGFPAGVGWQRLPAWLPQDRAVWTATATWVLHPAPASIEPVGALR